MAIKVYLFDADGSDQQLELGEVRVENLGDRKMLWIDVSEREKASLEKVVAALHLENVPLKEIIGVAERPKIDIFQDFYRFFIVSVDASDDEKETKVPIDFIVGKNFIVSIHKEKVPYFKEFLEHEKGETQIGELDAESFVAGLLDLHLVSYFRALENIEKKVDELDDKILRTDLDDAEMLAEMIALRNRVSKLRRWFVPHRDVFYALSRADFQRIAESDSAEQFKMLDSHFNNAVDSIESSRATVLSLFDLFATKSAQTTNNLVQRLTFITLIVGLTGVIAGILGMNYEVDAIFKSPYGFWVTLAGMIVLAISLTIVAKIRRWI